MKDAERCQWCTSHPLYERYHDDEWGLPVDDEYRLFEKICLEGFQSGLSWLTILRKRENFRKAFRQFDFNKVARFKEKDVERLVNDAGIVRYRGKEIGRFVCKAYAYKNTPGRIAIPCAPRGSLGSPREVRIWDAKSRRWNSGRFLVNSIVGWVR